MSKVIFKIIDMHCISCSLTIDGDLEDTEGVHRARTSYARAVSEIEYDPKKITVRELIQIIKRTGYSVEPQ